MNTSLAVEEMLQGLLDVSYASLAGDRSAGAGAKNVFLTSLMLLQLNTIEAAVDRLRASQKSACAQMNADSSPILH
jgi:hypothetical protein